MGNQGAESLQFRYGQRNNGRNAVETKKPNPPVRSGRTRGIIWLQVLSNPITISLQPWSDALHWQPFSAQKLGARSFHFRLENFLAERLGNKTGQGWYKSIVTQSLTLLLINEVYLLRYTPDAQDRMLCRIFKPRLHTINTAHHRTLPVSTNIHKLGEPHWVNNAQNFGAQVELVFCGLVENNTELQWREHLTTSPAWYKAEFSYLDTTCLERVQRLVQYNTPSNNEWSQTGLDICTQKWYECMCHTHPHCSRPRRLLFISFRPLIETEKRSETIPPSRWTRESS